MTNIVENICTIVWLLLFLFFMEIIVSNIKKLPLAIRDIQENYPKNRVFLLYGNLGAGKTTFVKTWCALLGAARTATSPTFSLINEYPYHDGIIYHADLYRLKNTSEAIDIGIEEYMYSGNYCFIEWAQVVETLVPEDTVRISIEILPKKARKLVIGCTS
jgi:tRNA threonylcarbamoyladenosine biosynthesis protein TsaE